ncbi:hypothetical protein [Pseudodonghicola xiamenensis]|uniref:Uncharacterized protein n=1 Tax=Pseudodonghicola xiamenensis TaxID=337702 RepID=A0A8J3H5W6_9RHOB|nr:hypothetical protein [Pseudodonghicola xiamenensis]GHG90669.1 hypothetical protein GCM10010961_21470 [Pseudodonghicola xiamenensis]
MAKPTKITLDKIKMTAPRAETPMDKISRAAMEIVDDETTQRRLRTERLRKARLEREANGIPGKNRNDQSSAEPDQIGKKKF